MTDDAFRNALAKRAQLQQELARIDNFIELYGELTGVKGGQIDVRQTATATVQGAGRQRSSGIRPWQIVQMVEDVLLTQGRPMTRTELTEALLARRAALAGEDKARYLGTILWRNRHMFVNLRVAVIG